MRVEYERSGGFAGARLATSFDLSELPQQEASTLQHLLEQADFSHLPESITGKSAVPDEFTHRITVTADTWKHTVRTGDTAAPESLRPLLDLLSQIARQRRGQPPRS